MHGGLTYLALARHRTNLAILPDTNIDHVLLDGKKARGVLTTTGQEIAGHEVILTSGAYNSPAILLRSGIGPAAHLDEVGIPLTPVRLKCALLGLGVLKLALHKGRGTPLPEEWAGLEELELS